MSGGCDGGSKKARDAAAGESPTHLLSTLTASLCYCRTAVEQALLLGWVPSKPPAEATCSSCLRRGEVVWPCCSSFHPFTSAFSKCKPHKLPCLPHTSLTILKNQQLNSKISLYLSLSLILIRSWKKILACFFFFSFLLEPMYFSKSFFLGTLYEWSARSKQYWNGVLSIFVFRTEDVFFLFWLERCSACHEMT